jgi:uncharacterized protein YndB with AHSA1/START domain
MARWLVFVLLGLVALIGIVAAVGLALPKGHRASRTVTLQARPSDVFEVVTNVARYPEWRGDVQRVELLQDDGHGTRFREVGRNGAITYRVELSEPYARVVTRIADTSLAFGGTWTYDLRPNGALTELTITEDGEVYNPIFRFLSKFVFSQYATIDTYLANLRKRLG